MTLIHVMLDEKRRGRGSPISPQERKLLLTSLALGASGHDGELALGELLEEFESELDFSRGTRDAAAISAARIFAVYRAEDRRLHADERLRWRQIAANLDDIPSQLYLARSFLERSETLAGSSEAGIYWLVRAAEVGALGAQEQLGLLYYRGKSIPRDFGRAKTWLDKAVLSGSRDRFVASALADMYARGLGVVPDPQEAAKWREMERLWQPAPIK